MFNNLAAEIARKGVKNNDFAEKVGIHPVTFSKKLNGKTDFTLKEVIRIIESSMIAFFCSNLSVSVGYMDFKI